MQSSSVSAPNFALAPLSHFPALVLLYFCRQWGRSAPISLRRGLAQVERLKLRKCPEFPTFSAFLARLPLGAGDGVERKDPSRDFSSVGSESNEREREGVKM